MLQGYMDDSGSEPKGQLFLLSGFILETEQWERFSDEWQFQLHRQPYIDYFKMHEAAARVGQFQGWNKEFALCKVKDLLSVIEHYAPTGISCLTAWNDYRAVLGDLAVDDLKGPYALLFQLVFVAIAHHQKSAGIYPTPIDVDFDDQGKVGRFAQQIFQDMREQFFSGLEGNTWARAQNARRKTGASTTSCRYVGVDRAQFFDLGGGWRMELALPPAYLASEAAHTI
jgi:hypothetical protein